MKQQPESQQHTSGSAFEQLEKLSVAQQHLRAESREAFRQAITKEPDIRQVYQLHLQTREQVQGLERQVRHLNRNLLLLNGMLTAFVVCIAVVCFWLFTRWLPEYRRGMVAAMANRATMDSPTHSTGSSSQAGMPIAMELKPISEGDRALYPLIFDL